MNKDDDSKKVDMDTEIAQTGAWSSGTTICTAMIDANAIADEKARIKRAVREQLAGLSVQARADILADLRLELSEATSGGEPLTAFVVPPGARASQTAPVTTMAATKAANVEFFRSKLGEYLENPLLRGKFVVVHDQQLRGSYDRFDVALRYAVAAFPPDEFIVQQVVADNATVSFI